MPWKKLTAIGVITYFILLISQFPANAAYSWVSKRLLPVQLINLEGSIWSGTASRVHVSEGLDLHKLSWHLSPWSLLLGRIGMHVQIMDPVYPGNGEVNIGIGQGIHLQNAKGRLPASMLRGIRGLEYLGLEGTIEYDLHEVNIYEGTIQSASGVVRLQQAKLNTPVDTEIGDIQFDIQTKEPNVEIVFRDIKSTFRIKGKIILMPERHFDYSATLTPTPASDPDIVSMLRNIAIPGKGQTLQFAYKGLY